MKPSHSTFTMAAASANAVCLSQTPSGAGNLTLNGALAVSRTDVSAIPSTVATVAVLDVPRHIAVACAGLDSGRTFTVYGTDRYGAAISQAVAGTNMSSGKTTRNFATVTRVAVDAATAGAVTVGTANSADTAWFPFSQYRKQFNVQVEVSYSSGASVTATPYSTLDDVQSPTFDANAASSTAGTGLTATGRFSYASPVAAFRLAITSFVGGTVSIHVLQA